MYIYTCTHTCIQEGRKGGRREERRKEEKEETKGKRKGNPHGFLGFLSSVFNKAKAEGAGDYDMFPDETDTDAMLSGDSARKGGQTVIVNSLNRDSLLENRM